MNTRIKLVLDVTGEYSLLYLIFDDQIYAKEKHLNNQDLSTKLNEYVNDLLASRKLKIEQVSDIYLVYGPGKFSGMRIASVFVKTLKMMYPFINLYVLDRFHFLSTTKNLIVLNADGNKYFIMILDGQQTLMDVQIVEQAKLDKILTIASQNGEIVLNYRANDDHVLMNLKYFQLTNEDFLLTYLKDPVNH